MTTRPSGHTQEVERQGLGCQPVRAMPVAVSKDMSVRRLMTVVLNEPLSQFTGNLHALVAADDAELVHQARVAWRRFRTLVRLFRKQGWLLEVPELPALTPLVAALGALRDVDVARLETLPRLAGAWVNGDVARERACAQLQKKLAAASDRQLRGVRRIMMRPATGEALLALTHWLNHLPETAKPSADWATQHVERLARQLQEAMQHTDTPQDQHQARIRAKRLRYSVESLRGLLPEKHAIRWLQSATDIQTTLGELRDVMQLAALAAQCKAAPALLAYLGSIASMPSVQT